MTHAKILAYLIVLLVYLCLIVPSARAATFGPERYIRTIGKPNVYAKNFNGTAGPAKLIVLNGEPNGQNTLSSALISINGVEVLAGELDRKVYRLERTVSLLVSNTIQVELRSNPGSYLTLSIEPQLTPPAPPVIDTTMLSAGPVTTPYSQTLQASGGTPPYTWNVVSGNLPQGLSLSQNGVVSGVPFSIGTSWFSVEVRDNALQTATRTFMLTTLSSRVKPLLGYWSFDDGTATDNSGFAITASTLVNSPAVVPGRPGNRNALNFNGIDQYVDAGPDLDAGSGELSIFAWVKTTQAGGSNMIISKRDSSGNTDAGGYQLFQNSSGALSFIISTLFTPTVIRVDSSWPKINDGNWHFVGVVFAKNTIGVGTLYVDGAPAIDGSGDLSSIMGNNVATNAPLRFGAEQQTDPAHLWQGAIDEVRIFTRRALSAQEVANLYNPPLTIVSNALPVGAINVPYKQTLTASGGTLPFWSKASGTLPPGLSVSQDGTISGTPTAPGTFSFTVVLDDASAVPPVTRAFDLTINATPATILFSDNFTGGLPIWPHIDEANCNDCEGPSQWVISNGDFVQRTNISDLPFNPDPLAKRATFAYVNNSWTDYNLSLRLMSEDNDALGVMFRFQFGNVGPNYYRFSMDSERHYRRLVKMIDGVATSLQEDAFAYEIGRSYNLRISVVGARIRIYLDNALVFDVLDASLSAGSIALYSWGNEYSHFGDVLLTSP